MKDMIRRSVSFHGRVQGVGFRYVSAMAADRYGVTGWVRNEYDGSVSMELQGTERDIDRVLRELNVARYIRIESMDVRAIPTVTGERGFRIRY